MQPVMHNVMRNVLHNVMHNVMHNVLILESSTEDGSVAVAIDGRIASEIVFTARNPVTGDRTESLAPSISQALSEAALEIHELSAVVCSGGPGGFTSLRSAAAIAKGICHALEIPLYSISSLSVLAWSANAVEGSYVAAIAAGRNEWFAAPFVAAADGGIDVGAELIAGADELRNIVARGNARIVGSGFEVQAVPKASAVVAQLGLVAMAGAVDLDSWEPAYGRLAEAQVKWEAAHGRPLVG